MIVVVVWLGGDFLSVAYQFYRAPRDLLQKAQSEGVSIVDAINEHRRKTGSYPKDIDGILRVHRFDPNWQWVKGDDTMPPRLSLHGSFHKSIRYAFPDPEDNAASGEWRLSGE